MRFLLLCLCATTGLVFAEDPAMKSARELAEKALGSRSYPAYGAPIKDLEAAEKQLASVADKNTPEAQLVRSTIQMARDGMAIYKIWDRKRDKVRSRSNKWNDKPVADLQATYDSLDELQEIGARYNFDKSHDSASFEVEKTAFEVAIKLRSDEAAALRAFDQPVSVLFEPGTPRAADIEAAARHQYEAGDFLRTIGIIGYNSPTSKKLTARHRETERLVDLLEDWEEMASEDPEEIGIELMLKVEAMKVEAVWFPRFVAAQKVWIEDQEKQLRAAGYIKLSEMPLDVRSRLGRDPWAEPIRFRDVFSGLVKAGQIDKALTMNKTFVESGAARPGWVEAHTERVLGYCFEQCETPDSPHREACANHLREVYHVTPPDDIKVAAFKPYLLFAGAGCAVLAVVLGILGLLKRGTRKAKQPLPRGWAT